MTEKNPDAVEKATGESTTGLAVMVIGAAVLAAFVVPYITKWFGITGTLALILAGIALAYFGKGTLRKAGQGAAVFGVATWAMSFLGPALAGIGAGTRRASDNGLVI